MRISYKLAICSYLRLFWSSWSDHLIGHLLQPLSILLPSVVVFYQLAAVFCITPADCERGFGIQNVIKTHNRSCLKPDTVQCLQMIRLEGPSI